MYDPHVSTTGDYHQPESTVNPLSIGEGLVAVADQSKIPDSLFSPQQAKRDCSPATVSLSPGRPASAAIAGRPLSSPSVHTAPNLVLQGITVQPPGDQMISTTLLDYRVGQASPAAAVTAVTPIRSSGVGNNSTSAQLQHRGLGDKALTQAKLMDLRRDISQLEAAIRKNENLRKDLDDWLFDQMAATDVSPAFTSTAAAGIRSVYDEKMQGLYKQSKSLYSRLEDTRYVVSQLEAQDLPLDVHPKTFVQELLRKRGKPRGGGLPASAVAAGEKDTLDNLPTTSRLVDSQNQSSQSYSNLSQLRTARTMSTPRTLPEVSLDRVVRLTKTLPAGGFPTESRTVGAFAMATGAAPLRATTSAFDPDFLGKKNSDPTLRIPVDNHQAEPGRLPFFSPYKSSSVCEGKPLEQKPSLPHSERLTQHPTSPDLLLFQHHQHQHQQQLQQDDQGLSPASWQVPFVSKMKDISAGNPGKGDQLSSNVLNSFRHGLESIGRRLPWAFKRRSVSEEDLTAVPQHKSPADRLLKPSRFSNWTSTKKQQSKQKNSPVSSFETPQQLQQPPPLTTLLDTMNARMPGDSSSQLGGIRRGASYSISNSSTNGLLPALPSGEDAGARSNSGWLTEEAQGTSSSSDHVLSRIFEMLADASVPQGQSRVVLGSSGSSVSMIGAPSASLPSNGRSLEAQQQQQQHQQQHSAAAATTAAPVAISPPLAPAAAVGQAFAVYHRYQDGKLAALTRHHAEYFRVLHDELTSLKYQNTELHNTLINVTAQLESIRRDVNTSEELHQQHLSNAATRIEQLDANAEKAKQDLHFELFKLGNEMTSKVESLEYQLTTKTRDLDDNITSLSNKVSILEKPQDSHSQSFGHGSELSRCGRKVMHYLIDLFVSLFALVTMLLQLLIRFLNLGAVITENRSLAIGFMGLLSTALMLVYLSGPLLVWLQPNASLPSPSFPSSSSVSSNQVTTSEAAVASDNSTCLWRDAIISFLTFLHRFNAR